MIRQIKHFTKDDIDLILSMSEAGKTAAEIASALGRTAHSVYQFLYRYRRGMHREAKAGIKPTIAPAAASLRPTGVIHENPQPKSMSPREMIKALYDMGYRIENNQLVCYVKQTVKMQDIIHDN